MSETFWVRYIRSRCVQKHTRLNLKRSLELSNLQGNINGSTLVVKFSSSKFNPNRLIGSLLFPNAERRRVLSKCWRAGLRKPLKHSLFTVRCIVCLFYLTTLSTATITQRRWYAAMVELYRQDKHSLFTVRCIVCLFYLTLRLLMSYIYGAPILDVSRSYTTTHHSR